jgi:MFS family permease
MLVAREADAIGAPRTLAAQGICIAIGAIFCAGLPGPESAGAPRAPRQPLRLEELFAGARFVWSSPLRAVWPLVAGVGLFFSGAYNVLFPVMVRDRYGGGVSELGLLLFAFPLGTIFASAWLFVRGMRRKGAALAGALGAGAVTVIGAGFEIRFEALLALTFVWGLAGGVFMTAGRALFQERAPASERARILAVHQLAMVASGPIGALLSGALGDALGPSRAVLVQGIAMLGLIALVLSRSNVWRME